MKTGQNETLLNNQFENLHRETSNNTKIKNGARRYLLSVQKQFLV